MTSTECWSCLSNAGHRRISPGEPVHVSQFWQVEHAYPSGLLGWLVIVLRRHVEALHDVTSEEFKDLAVVLERTTRALRKVLNCDKEYVACFAELEHFKHVHFHVIPRAVDMPGHFIGTKSFDLLKVSHDDAIPAGEVQLICKSLRAAFDS